MNLLEKAKASKKKPNLELGEEISSESVKIIDTTSEITEEIIDKVKELTPKLKGLSTTLTKKSKKLQIASTPKISDAPNKKGKKGRVFAFIGKHGTGKSYACCNFAERFKKSFIIDPEYKISEILDEQYPNLTYDEKRPILDEKKKYSQIFKESSDIHIDVAQVINKTTGKRDNIATIQYIKNNTPYYIQAIKSGKYKNFIIDSCSPIREYALSEWLRKERKKNPTRERPTKFEYSEVEAIIQDILLPFVNYCKIYDINLILTFGIVGHYVNDILIGYKEDAKQWLLSIFSYELWFEYDYYKYCLKHTYNPFWCIKDKDLNISEYLFDKEFIDENDDIEFKDFEDFKYESMTSESFRKDVKKRAKGSLKIG